MEQPKRDQQALEQQNGQPIPNELYGNPQNRREPYYHMNLNPFAKKHDYLEQTECVTYEEEQTPDQAKKLLSKLGFALLIMAAVVLLIQVLLENIAYGLFPAFAETSWYVLTVTAISVVGVGLPVFYFMTKRIPNTVRGEKVKLTFPRFMSIFFISVAVMYITNFFSAFLTAMIALAKGDDIFSLNPLIDVLNGSNFIITLLYAAIIAPTVEELIFRKLLLDKLRRFGDIPAILLTGIAFGLFHMNLSQFFYATALGIIFAYVAIRTNTVKYSILLHIMINFIGTVIAPLATEENMAFYIILICWVLIAIALGTVFFILNIRKIRLFRSIHPMVKKSDYLFNTGSVLYILLCLVIIVFVTVS